jgi:diacylglycerol kinase (ATP)
MIKRARLIYNPTSGREEMRRRLPDILARLERHGLETSCHATTGKGDATAAAAEAVERNFDVVIAAGGDGTIHEVINGLAEKPRRPKLGILPVGTTNDFARALHIPRNLMRACDIIGEQFARPIDVGKVNDRFFINIAGGGSMTELTYEVPSKLKTMIGQLAYYVKGIEKLPWLRPFRLRIEADGFRLDEECMLFLVANSNTVAGFERLAPDAYLDDGKLDVLVLKKCNLADFIRIVTLATRGEHLNDPRVLYVQASRLKVESKDYTQLNLDGELGGTLPCEISVLPSHLEVILDRSSLENAGTDRRRGGRVRQPNLKTLVGK